ncbi:hypothetical protein SynROS8604_01192 [Synechococcus sp. ROS8604]|nr:hypothetical protein SynROS8604_01192 [Synechococcus sp. ROS8604]
MAEAAAPGTDDAAWSVNRCRNDAFACAAAARCSRQFQLCCYSVSIKKPSLWRGLLGCEAKSAGLEPRVPL